ncbi:MULTISPECIES: hypothetical protein [unclassified Streptomyces]|uniref:hypothetical protein n=1 Tax=unclassified Streptomyces TaxID=2593676 RepID=UPI002DD95496|nr:hypothetical protein [Streptomyces sp. NBC_01294]WRZ60538.1 hypothetical protein OG534_31050 [Streptomyces sp. NBC_01294]
MDTNPLTRFIKALAPDRQAEVEALPRPQQEAMAEDWERRLRDDVSLLTLSELDPHRAETQAAQDVVGSAGERLAG